MLSPSTQPRLEGGEQGWRGGNDFLSSVQGQEVQSATVTAKQPGGAGKDPVPGSVGAPAHIPLGVVGTGWEQLALLLGAGTVSITAPGKAFLMSSCKHWVIIP